jgi:hypothetical protein
LGLAPGLEIAQVKDIPNGLDGPILGMNGMFAWGIRWKLATKTKVGGAIIQHVRAQETILEPKSEVNKTDFYEAWRVSKNSDVTTHLEAWNAMTGGQQQPWWYKLKDAQASLDKIFKEGQERANTPFGPRNAGDSEAYLARFKEILGALFHVSDDVYSSSKMRPKSKGSIEVNGEAAFYEGLTSEELWGFGFTPGRVISAGSLPSAYAFGIALWSLPAIGSLPPLPMLITYEYVENVLPANKKISISKAVQHNIKIRWNSMDGPRKTDLGPKSP